MLSGARILVVGGTGVVGRIVARDLALALPGARVIVAGRPPAAETAKGTGFRQLDIRDREAAASAVAAADLVILAAGPFEAFGASVHAICVEAGVDVLDINDSASAAAEVVALDPRAKAKGVRILTGMGLAPGLSTLLLFKLAGRAEARPGPYRARLYTGARNGGGPSNGGVLLAGFKRRLPAIVDGETVERAAPWAGRDARFVFREAAARFASCPSPRPSSRRSPPLPARARSASVRSTGVTPSNFFRRVSADCARVSP